VLGWEVLRQGHALLRDRKLYHVYGDLLAIGDRTCRGGDVR
jgi:hypothetical protein